MDTLKKTLMWIGGAVLAVFVGLLVLGLLVGIGHSIHSSVTHRYWINTADSTYYTNSYEEKDGCLLFTDELERKVKHCGLYSISDKGVR